MNRKAVLRAVVFVLGLGLAASLPALADDSAAAIAAGGLVPRRETRIVMAREVLQISLKKIVVDYDFRNDTDQDVTTEVAFPVPSYDWGVMSMPPSISSIPDFRLFIDGKPVPFQTEAKAILDNGKNVADILVADGIDVTSFGHADDDVRIGRDILRLPESEKKRLAALGIIDLDNDNNNTANGYIANWTVHLQYHWKQTFPAHSTVHIRHEYPPFAGFAYYYGDGGLQQLIDAGKIPVVDVKPKPLNPYDRGDLTSFCFGLPLAKSMAATFTQQSANATTENDENSNQILWMQWVDFILTSANTWHRPIEDFTLIVERPKPEHGGKMFISFCSPGDGKVEKAGVDLLQVHLTNFVPASELHIGFFEVPLAKASQPAAKK